MNHKDHHATHCVLFASKYNFSQHLAHITLLWGAILVTECFWTKYQQSFMPYSYSVVDVSLNVICGAFVVFLHVALGAHAKIAKCKANDDVVTAVYWKSVKICSTLHFACYCPKHTAKWYIANYPSKITTLMVYNLGGRKIVYMQHAKCRLDIRSLNRTVRW